MWMIQPNDMLHILYDLVLDLKNFQKYILYTFVL